MSEPDQSHQHSPGHICPAEHAGWLHSPLRRLINDPKRLLRGLVAPGYTAVDLGCGPGYYTLPLAKMVGESGRVIAVDVQEGMLAQLRVRAEKAGLSPRIQPHLAGGNTLDVSSPADFALAFWMLHEVPDQLGFLRQVHDMLRPRGRLLLAEPLGHVSKTRFTAVIAMAEQVGLRLVGRPRVGFSRTALFERPSPGGS